MGRDSSVAALFFQQMAPRRLFKLFTALLVWPVPLHADPLGNLAQVFPIVDFFLSTLCALFIWNFAFRRATGRSQFAWRWPALVVAALLIGIALVGFGPAALFFLVLALPATVVASPVLGAWCVLWWWLAARAYRQSMIPPLATAVLGTIAMVALSGSFIWAIFPNECRTMFHLS